MDCPQCAADKSRIRVQLSRHDTVESIVRRRVCLDCDYAWYTCEVELPEGSTRWAYDANTNYYSAIERLPKYRRLSFT